MVEIYSLVDPTTGLVRYVGQSRSAKVRYAWHIQAARRGEVGRVYNWIRSLLSGGVVPTFEVIETCSESKADSREVYWIHELRHLGLDLTNLTDGGGGTRGWRHSDDAKSKIGSAHRGKFVSVKTRERISAAKAGLTLTPAHKDKIRKSNLGREVSLAARKKLSVLRQGNTFALGVKRSVDTLMKMRQSARRGELSDKATLSNIQAQEVRSLFTSGVRQCDLARRYKVSAVTIHRVVRGKTYAEL